MWQETSCMFSYHIENWRGKARQRREKKMKAVGLYRSLPLDHPESLIDLELEKPTPTGRDLLITVKAVSVNPVDIKVRASREQGEHSPRILGWDASGIVEAVGSECTLFKPGDPVYYAGDITRPGSNSEYHLVDERIVGHKPVSLDFAEAAALPLTTITAWEGFFDRLGFSKLPERNQGKNVLIIGAAGGVGSIATQLARWAGLTVIGSASRPESIQWAKDHGSDLVINHQQAFAPQLKQLGFATVETIFCLNTTEAHWGSMAEVIAPQGKICAIVPTSAPVDLNALQSKSITFVWELMYTRPIYQTTDLIEQHRLLNTVADLVDGGQLQTTLTQRLSQRSGQETPRLEAGEEWPAPVGDRLLACFFHPCVLSSFGKLRHSGSPERDSSLTGDLSNGTEGVLSQNPGGG
jgi:zinc-binding alcohol dehydrogenase family protein